MNWAFILGVVEKKPRLWRSRSGIAVASLNIITEESFVLVSGKTKFRPEYHYVEVYSNQAERCLYFLQTGSIVMVEGRLRTRQWTDSKGIDRSLTVIMAMKIKPVDDLSSKIFEWAIMPPAVIGSAKDNTQQSKTIQIIQ